MSGELFKELEKFRKKKNLSIMALCRKLRTSNNNYYRWKEADKITGPYRKIIEEFLDKDKTPLPVFSQPSSDIAVIGVSCRYPGAKNIKELWENILSRRVEFRRMLDQRLPLKDYYNEKPGFPDKIYLTQAALIDGFNFNWGNLRIPKKTFQSSDIAHWLALDTALRAFEDAGYQAKGIPFYQSHNIPTEKTGVILGNTLTGEQTRSMTLRLRWPYVRKTLSATLKGMGIAQDERFKISEAMENIYKSAFFPITEDTLAGGLANTIAGRICNYLNLHGGGYVVDGACSSSLLAVATAANALRLREMDLVLAGGVDVSLDPFELVGFSQAGALAKDQMRVYDKRASGFVPGEGCGFVLLKRLDDALRDKDYIYATVKGWGVSSDGKGGIMEPSSSGQARAIGRAYNLAGYSLADVDFVEGHGTGTIKGDKVELGGIARVLNEAIGKMNESAVAKCSDARLQRVSAEASSLDVAQTSEEKTSQMDVFQQSGKRICGVTSFKSIVGHTKAASGIGGFIKAVLAVNQRVLPPTASCQEPNEIFEDEAKALYPIINGKVYPSQKTLRAGISSAGFGGINCHLTIESKAAPKKALKPEMPQEALLASNQNTEIFVFASSTIIHLDKLIKKFKEDLHHVSMAEMADLSARLTKKLRLRAPIKVAIVTNSPEHLYEAVCVLEERIALGHWDEGMTEIKSKDPSTYILIGNQVKDNRIAFLYPGQGAAKLNMTRTLVDRFKWAGDLLKFSKIPLKDYIYTSDDQCLTQEEKVPFQKKLSQTEITQPAVVFSSLLWTEFLSKLSIEPNVVAGHSLGELAAFYKAGAFDKRTLLKFSEFRGKVMSGKTKSAGMVSLFCTSKEAKAILAKARGNVVISNINSPHQIIVSGALKEIEKVIVVAKKQNIATHLLPVSNAFHSSFMRLASEKIATNKILKGRFRPGRIKIYSSTCGQAIGGEINLKEYFSTQVLTPVDFVKLIESISRQCDLFIEVGPGRILTDLVKAINGDKGPQCFPVEGRPQNDRDLNIVLAQLFVRNVKVNFSELYRNRSIKPFIPVSRRKFITNQCEQPLKGGLQGEELKSKIIEPAHGKEPEPEVIAASLAVQIPVDGSKGAVSDLLLNLTHKMTGFDLESLHLNLRLLDDLNLDSIKAAELIADASKALELTGQIDPSQYSNKTLAQISERFMELRKEAAEIDALIAEENILRRYSHKSWVRNFVVEFKGEEIEETNADILKNLKAMDILCDRSDKGFVEKFSRQGKGERIKFKIKTYEESRKFKAERNDCLICFLPKPKGIEDAGMDEARLKRIIARLHLAMRAATAESGQAERTVIFVQFGAGDFSEKSEVGNIESSCIRAFASTLHLERPDLKMRILDFPRSASPASVFEKITEELQTPSPFSIAGYTKALRRQVPAFSCTEPVSYKKRNIKWSSSDVILVTGGAKGITAECALEFARKTKARMILVGRSKVSLKKDLSHEINRTLKRFKEENLNCQYYSSDVTNPSDVKKLIKRIEKTHGKISGLIHGAGLNSLKRLKQSKIQEAYVEALPKVMGAVNICRELQENQLKLIVGLTSVIGVTGMEGSGWYGLANEILDLFLSQFKAQHKSTAVLSMAYSIWDDIGMGAKLGSQDWLLNKGIASIPIAEGVKRFMQFIEGDSGHRQQIVVARINGLDTWRSPATGDAGTVSGSLRFMEDIKYHMPGIEIIAQAHLNTLDDPYVLDHNWKGSLLLPLVFGLEAMMQAVSLLTDTRQYQGLEISDIHLSRPIPVSEESGATIEIHAQVLELEKSQRSPCFKVDIYSRQTGFKTPHFSALFKPKRTFVALKKESLKIKNNLDLNPQEDLYGPVLFQGGPFQCIERVHDLFYDEVKNRGEALLSISRNKTMNDFIKRAPKFRNGFLLRDLFFMDSILQSMQVIITPRMALPEYIGKISLALGKEKKQKGSIVKSVMRRIDEKMFGGDAYDIKQGLSIKGFQLKVLGYLSEKPNANDLANPTARDQVRIENQLNELAQQMSVAVPVIRCLYDARLKHAKKQERHRIEIPLIQRTVEDLLRGENKEKKSIKVQWSKSGKPRLIGKVFEGVDVSLSHCGSMLICSAGYLRQGCDIENMVKREAKDWMALLGREKFALQKDLMRLGLDCNLSGAAIWSAAEAFSKLFNRSQVAFDFFDNYKNQIIFQSHEKGEKITICSMPLETTLGAVKILSFSINSSKERDGLEDKVEINGNTLRKVGFNENQLFRVSADYSGPQKQLVLTQRFPVTFKQNQMLSRKVYFTNYFDWMGTIREYSVYPTFRKLAKLAESGEWGLVTNMTELKILGGIKSGDIVEAKIWGGELEGEKKETTPMFYEWFRITYGGRRERVAAARQKSTWVNVKKDHSVHIEEMPRFLGDYLHLVRPMTEEVFPRESCPEPYRNINLGKKFKSYCKGVAHQFKISGGEFSTTLENSNLVGNIYFANYAKWLGSVGDRLFYRLIPDYFTNVENKNEIICLECNIYYLHDAFPFETIRVEMYLEEIYEHGLKLYFEFHRMKEGKKEMKLAYAYQKIVFAHWANDLIPDPIKVPDLVLKFMKSKETM